MLELREYSRNSAGELLRDRMIAIVPDAIASRYVEAHQRDVSATAANITIVHEPLRRYQVRDAQKHGVFDSARTIEAALAIATMFRAQDDVAHVIDTETGETIDSLPESQEAPAKDIADVVIIPLGDIPTTHVSAT